MRIDNTNENAIIENYFARLLLVLYANQLEASHPWNNENDSSPLSTKYTHNAQRVQNVFVRIILDITRGYSLRKWHTESERQTLWPILKNSREEHWTKHTTIH